MLYTIVGNKRICGPDCLDKIIERDVTVYGFGPNLEQEIEEVTPIGTIISADGATGELVKKGIFPDIFTTDLDGNVEAQILANGKGAVAVIHAHGDNIQRLKDCVPFFPGRITPTTQAKPFDKIYNFGGFTDGDRAVMIARHFGATRILLVGFDFVNARMQRNKDMDVKRRKLEWAHRLIYELNPPKVMLSTP